MLYFTNLTFNPSGGGKIPVIDKHFYFLVEGKCTSWLEITPVVVSSSTPPTSNVANLNPLHQTTQETTADAAAAEELEHSDLEISLMEEMEELTRDIDDYLFQTIPTPTKTISH